MGRECSSTVQVSSGLPVRWSRNTFGGSAIQSASARASTPASTDTYSTCNRVPSRSFNHRRTWVPGGRGPPIPRAAPVEPAGLDPELARCGSPSASPHAAPGLRPPPRLACAGDASGPAPAPPGLPRSRAQPIIQRPGCDPPAGQRLILAEFSGFAGMEGKPSPPDPLPMADIVAEMAGGLGACGLSPTTTTGTLPLSGWSERPPPPRPAKQGDGAARGF
jgi:hypothetical protein